MHIFLNQNNFFYVKKLINEIVNYFLNNNIYLKGINI